MIRKELARMIDHTILKANATEQQVRDVVLFAKKENTASVCLHPFWVPMAAELLAGTDVAVCSVAGFPLGANCTASKAFEAAWLHKNGASEVDMVLNVGALKSGMLDAVRSDVEAVVKASPAKVKVILENCYLTKDEIATACRLCAQAGAAFVKTSTGLATGGATVADVRLMRQSVPADVQVKAAGGIACYDDAIAMIEAGASRIGASRTAAILDEADARS